MKRNWKRIMLLSVLTAVIAACLSLSAWAATSNLIPKGVDRTDPDFVPSGYSDVDENDGWILLTLPSKNANVVISKLPDGMLSQPKFSYGSGYKAYFHERMGKLVYVITSSSFTGNWGDEKQYTGEMVAAGKANRVINVDEEGAYYNQVYWNTKNTDKVKTLEFRLPTDRAYNYTVHMNNPGYATWGLAHLETVIFDYRIKDCTYLRNYTSQFNDAKTLISSGHVEFNTDGSVDLDSERNTFKHGEVNLTALATISGVSSSTGELDFGGMLDGKTNVSRVIFFDKLKNKDGTDASYRIPKTFFKNCTGLREVVFPAELGNVGEYAFQNCTDLKLYLKGGYSNALSFDLNASTGKINAFEGAENITFVVNKYEDVADLRAILDSNGLYDISVECDFEPALTPICYTARTESYNGIRGIFSFRPGTAAKNEAAGYTINEYGVIACSLEKYNSFGGTPEKIYGVTNRAIKKMIVFGPANSANRYIDEGTKTFCMTVKSIGSAYYSSELCIFAYEKWITPEGETKVYFSQITDPNSPEVHWTTLYRETKELLDSGKVTASSTGYSIVIKPVLDSVSTLAITPAALRREDYL